MAEYTVGLVNLVWFNVERRPHLHTRIHRLQQIFIICQRLWVKAIQCVVQDIKFKLRANWNSANPTFIWQQNIDVYHGLDKHYDCEFKKAKKHVEPCVEVRSWIRNHTLQNTIKCYLWHVVFWDKPFGKTNIIRSHVIGPNYARKPNKCNWCSCECYCVTTQYWVGRNDLNTEWKFSLL